jgi:hypothetical protein
LYLLQDEGVATFRTVLLEYGFIHACTTCLYQGPTAAELPVRAGGVTLTPKAGGPLEETPHVRQRSHNKPQVQDRSSLLED